VRPNDGAGWRSRAARAGAWLGVACALALALAAGPFASAAAAQGGGLPLQTFATGTGTPSLPTGWTQSTVDTGVTETWHVQPSPQTVRVENPTIDPDLVTLPDPGFLPERQDVGTGGITATSGVAWFGDSTTGTYCGTDFTQVTQTSLDGCTSNEPQQGDLTSPTFSLAGDTSAVLTFDSWWEIEAVAGQSYDLMSVQYSTDGGSTWTPAGSLNPASATDGSSDQDFTSGGGIEVPGVWQPYTVDLSGAAGSSTVQVRFDFNTGDELYNGFRGWLLDDATVTANGNVGTPTISGLSPSSVDCSNLPEVVDVVGSNFGVGSTVLIDGSPAVASSDLSDTEMQFVADPSLSTGAHIVQVQAANGTTTSNAATLNITCGSAATTSSSSSTPSPVTTQASSATTSATTTSSTTTSTSTTPKFVPPPPPVLFRDENVAPVSGTVLIKLPPGATLATAASAASLPFASDSLTKGTGFIPLTQARQIPVGSVLNTTGGTVAITAASPTKGKFFTGQFTAGIFELLQNRKEKGLTQATLQDTVNRKKACVSVGKKASTASSKKVSSKVLGLLKSTDNGKFSTRGSYSAATVRGTAYSVEDNCAGTLTTVTRGSVVVDYFRRHKMIVVKAGHAFLAKVSGGPSSVVSIGKQIKKGPLAALDPVF